MNKFLIIVLALCMSLFIILFNRSPSNFEAMRQPLPLQHHSRLDYDDEKVIYNKENGPKKQSKNNKLIYFDTIWYEGSRFGGALNMEKIKCPEVRCTFTSNKRYREEADVVMFGFSRNQPKYRPSSVPTSQLWVCADVESANAGYEPSQHCNLTLSYHTNSDLPSGYYGYFLPFNYTVRPLYPNIIDTQSTTYAAYLEALEADFSLDSFLSGDTIDFLLNRNQTLAWMSSHCQTRSRREELAAALQKFLPFDVYGSCGTKTCFKRNPYGQDCWITIINKYMFYLSMENSLCDQYVSEKLYLPMMYGLIPIVYGDGPYEKILPPHSYINARDYGVEKLAELITDLRDHPEKRARYHLWRGFYTVHVGGSHCELCHLLHSDSDNLKNRRRWDDRNVHCSEVPKSFSNPW